MWSKIVNISAFAVVVSDKVLAKFKLRRIPEKIILLFPALGGGLGGLVGMALCNHKIKKNSFLLPYMGLMVCNFIGANYYEIRKWFQ